MSALWLPSNDVTCVQPWDAQFVGHEAVTRSWASLFEGLQDGGVIAVREGTVTTRRSLGGSVSGDDGRGGSRGKCGRLRRREPPSP